MEFNASYFHAFGNPDFAAVFSGGSAQALRPPCPSAGGDGDGASVGAVAKQSTTVTTSSVTFTVPDEELGEAQHFLNECSRCRKCLTGDIFMYRSATTPTIVVRHDRTYAACLQYCTYTPCVQGGHAILQRGV